MGSATGCYAKMRSSTAQCHVRLRGTAPLYDFGVITGAAPDSLVPLYEFVVITAVVRRPTPLRHTPSASPKTGSITARS